MSFPAPLKEAFTKEFKNPLEGQKTLLNQFIDKGLPVRQNPWWSFLPPSLVHQFVNGPTPQFTYQEPIDKLKIKRSGNQQAILAFKNGQLDLDITQLPSEIDISLLPVDQLPSYLIDKWKKNSDFHLWCPLKSAFTPYYYYFNIRKSETPINLRVTYAYSENNAEARQNHILNHIQVQPGAQINWIRANKNSAGQSSNNNQFHFQIDYFELEEQARLNFAEVDTSNSYQFKHHSFFIRQKTSSQVQTTHLHLDPEQIKKHLEVDLTGVDAHFKINVLNQLNNRNSADINIKINHLSETTYSDQLVKTSLDHQAKSFFTGNIHVPQDSQQIKASQMTKNLLLSKQTQSINQPQLEVYADDVECAHGSTTGSLDHDQLFYLTSRGIEKNKAIQMLSQGFVLDLVNQVDSEWIKKELLEFINQREQ